MFSFPETSSRGSCHRGVRQAPVLVLQLPSRVRSALCPQLGKKSRRCRRGCNREDVGVDSCGVSDGLNQLYDVGYCLTTADWLT